MPQDSMRPQRTWKTWFRSVFSFDYRSLATFRILVGLTLISDLIFRAKTFGDMYTEAGLVTRELSKNAYRVLVGPEVADSVWSLYWISESTGVTIALFVVAMVFAILLTLGLFTRIATIASWVLLVSLHARNPLILSSGDFILKMSLFWSIFLPLGQIWSLDAKRRSTSTGKSTSGKNLATMATAGFMLQLIFMYFFTGVAKLNADWFSGDAMYYVLRLDIYITEFGRSLLQYEQLLKFVSWSTLFVEVIFIWAMLLSWRNGLFRMLNLLIYWAFHAGIGVSMDIGLFPIICMVIWVPLIPTSVWDRTSRSVEPERQQLDSNRYLNAFCGLMIAFILLWNVFNIETKTLGTIAEKIGWGRAVQLGYFMRVDQHFQMFGHPPKENPWFVYEGKLKDGTEVDLLRDRPVDHERPESVRHSLPGHHWRKFHRNLVHPRYSEFRQSLADFVVRKWNREHDKDQQVDRLRVICYLEPTGPQYNVENRASLVWGSYTDPNRDVTNIFKDLEQLENGPLF